MKKLNEVFVLKTTILVFSLIFFAGTAFARGIKVPIKVHRVFSKKFPDAQNLEWNEVNTHEYSANFRAEGYKYTADFNSNGKLLETKKYISANQLPAIIKKALNKKYHNPQILGASYIVNFTGQSYKVDAEIKGQSRELVYSINGKLLSH